MISRNRAETVALTALGWLAANEELLPVFLGASGSATDDLRGRAEDPEFLASVLDFLLMDDTWIVTFCTDAGLDPSEPAVARRLLPGGDEVHWT